MDARCVRIWESVIRTSACHVPKLDLTSQEKRKGKGPLVWIQRSFFAEINRIIRARGVANASREPVVRVIRTYIRARFYTSSFESQQTYETWIVFYSVPLQDWISCDRNTPAARFWKAAFLPVWTPPDSAVRRQEVRINVCM